MTREWATEQVGGEKPSEETPPAELPHITDEAVREWTAGTHMEGLGDAHGRLGRVGLRRLSLRLSRL